jgi:hypothetical protein
MFRVDRPCTLCILSIAPIPSFCASCYIDRPMSTKFIATLKSVGDSGRDIFLVSRSVEIAKEENDGRARSNEN